MLGLPALLLALLPLTQALPAVTRTGNYLYANGQRITFKGVAYQEPGAVAQDTAENQANGGFPEPSDYTDPLSNVTQCQADLPNLATLGVNAIRVYNVNPYVDHSGCMDAFDKAGIYVLADLALPLNGSINRASPSWDVSLLNAYIATIDSLRSYSNLAAFTVGNEIITGPTNTNAAPFVKAAARDVKAYLTSVNSSILTMYASTDGDASWVIPLADYMACDSANTSVDIWGLNNYRPAASYAALTAQYDNYPVAAVFSEFGDIDNPPRTFDEVATIFSSSQTQVWSGGFAFEYFEGSDGYGITSNATSPPTLNADGQALATQYSSATLPTTPAASSVAASTYASCPAATTNFTASSTLPPTPNAAFCSCLEQTVFPCVVKPGTTPVILGELLDYACNQLGSAGGNCDQIAGNGATGNYGQYSFCSPETKVSYAFSNYFASQNYVATACMFAGNATVNSAAPRSTDLTNTAIAACTSADPTAVFSASSAVQTGPASNSASNSDNKAAKKDDKSGAKSVFASFSVVLSMALVAASLA